MKRILLFICFWGSLMIHAAAQLYQYLDTQDGLSSRRVLCIQKDRKGYMWFLTHKGIDRYNGKQYKHYELTAQNRTLNAFPNLNTLAVDTTGTVWEIGKSGHIFRYNSLQDRFELMCDLTEKNRNNDGLPLTASYFDAKHGRILLCTKEQQYLFDTRTREVLHLESAIREEITYIAQAADNQYFLATSHKIYCVQLHQNRLEIIPHPALDHFHIVNYVYFHTETQTLIIGTLLDGIYLYDMHQQRLTDLVGGLQDINVNAIVVNTPRPEEVLIATNGAGVYKLDMKTYQLTPFLSAIHNRSNHLNGNIINDLYFDDEHKLWMAVYPIGITVYADKYSGYKWIQHSYNNLNSLIDNQVNYILEDSEGDIWYATNNGVCYYSPRTQQWRSVLSTYHNDNPNQNHIFISLCESSSGNILAGGYMSGIYHIRKKDMSVEYFTPNSQKPNPIKPDKYIRCIYKDKENIIWAGGYYNLKRYDLKSQETQRLNMDFPITCITEKDAQNLWVGTINGLYQLDKVRRELKPVKLNPELGCINTIYQSDNHITYIGTHGAGMWVYNNETQRITNYHTNNSALISNNIYCILPSSEEDALIISTGEGITRFRIKDKTFYTWTKEQGLISTSFNPAAGIHTREHQFIFGCGDGAIELCDTVLPTHPSRSRMVFDDFRILNQRVVPKEKGSPLKEEIDNTRHITLSYKQNFFSLEVASINYDNPSNIIYSWKLEGFYDEWTTPSLDNHIRYTNIEPGDYKLRVRAILMDDNHVMEERTLHITVTPPFWRTYWAGLLYLSGLFLLGSILLRVLWIRKDRDNSKEKIRFFINTAHDIRTPLTLIKAPLGEILKNEQLSEQGKTNISMAIKNTDNLSELATNLINFEKEELYTTAVYVSRYELNTYIRNYLDQFLPYANKRQISIRFETNFEAQEIWMDRNKMDSIIRNLMTNALKYTRQGGQVTVQTYRNKSHWFLTISDTGIGIPAKEQRYLFKRLFRGNNAVNLQITGSGIGMLLTYKLIKSHNGQISMESIENKGTTFKLSFPIKSRKYSYRVLKQPAPVGTTEASTVLEENMEMSAQALPAPPSKAELPLLLIVEDNVELRSFLKQILSEEYNIQEAGNGQEALDFIKEQKPDLILSDIMMPVMSGNKMCRILKDNAETCHIPVVLLTALNDKESIIKGLQTKADKYIIKPFDVDVLKADIASVLANKRMTKPLPATTSAEHPMHAADTAPDPDQAFLAKVTETIKLNINKELNVETLCTALNMSRSSFYNKIKALTNNSPSDFIRQVRMDEASILLKSKRYTVSEVSDMLGFSDPKYFTDTFKKYYKVPPSTYMKQN